MFHQRGWWSYVRYDEDQDRPKMDRALLRRVFGYASAYRLQISIVVVTIFVISLLTALQPLVVRELLDDAIPNEDLGLVTWLGIALVAIALGNGVIGVAQRWASATQLTGLQPPPSSSSSSLAHRLGWVLAASA